MHIRLWVGVLLTGIVSAPTAFPQGLQDPSHVPIPGVPSDPRVTERLLADRLGKARDMAELQKFLQDPRLLELARDVMRDPKKYGVEDQIKNLRDGQKPDLNDPKWRELLGKVLGDRAGPPGLDALPPAQRDAIKRLLDKVGPATPPSPPDAPPFVPQTPDPARPVDPVRPPDASPPDSEPLTPARQQSQERFGRWLGDFAERFENSRSSLTDTPAARQFARDITRLLGDQRPNNLGFGERTARWASQLPPLAEYLPADRLPRIDWPKPDPSWFDGMPRMNWGDLRPPTIGNASVPAVGVSAAGSGVLQGLLLLLTAAVLVGLAVLLWRKSRPASAEGAEEARRLGPWPVDPAALRTRDDVVKAFEHLALLKLGQTVRSWNHRQIAARLASAERVADLYQQARYAPPHETLSEADLSAARRELTALAGGAVP